PLDHLQRKQPERGPKSAIVRVARVAGVEAQVLVVEVRHRDKSFAMPEDKQGTVAGALADSEVFDTPSADVDCAFKYPEQPDEGSRYEIYGSVDESLSYLIRFHRIYRRKLGRLRED